MKKKLPLLIILTGFILLGIGLWQYVHSKVQSHTALAQAKELVSRKQTTAEVKKNKEHAASPNTGDTVGVLVIPKIKAELAIVEGTDPDDLEKGVGHYKGSYFPGDKGQIVLSGHRDTVFRKLGELKLGDQLKMQMPNGNYTYEITHTKIVKSNDKSIITLQKQQEELILTTCYPFHYVGNAPKRYIVYAKLIRH
ncbi:class D sortase [Neobacillus cucumis]|uniref:Class D sortase n=1 Tax=Neobacillus cucumis TaxID=1740721 RepID=A0A2N5HAS8_9BACI|nr:class D sortase [Neobacillus cucumis]PLS02612.1 class D sortase [Neobacillus cucumis]